MKETLRINLALQGGGAHGAFTWGVLDALLEDPRVKIGWISGTSAGAVNAAALVSGLAEAGRDGARDTLRNVWTRVVDAAVPDVVKFNPLLALPWETLTRSGTIAQMASLMSPYEFNPLGIDPLRDILTAEIHPDLVRTSDGPELLIAATDVATGRARLFRRADFTIDVIIASACLPTLHQAVEIDGRAYWDGGFSANPELLTLADESPVGDTLIIQLAPLSRSALPTTARDIATHVAHLTFNRPYVEQIARIVAARQGDRRPAWLSRLVAGSTADDRVAHHRFHMVDGSRHTSAMPAGSQIKPDEAAVTRLFHAGRTEGAKWLERHGADVGRRDSAALEQRFAV